MLVVYLCVALLIVGSILLILGIFKTNLILLLLGLILLIPIIILVITGSKKQKKQMIEWSNSNIERDRICLQTIEPVYVSYAERVTRREFRKNYKLVENPDVIVDTRGDGNINGSTWLPSENGVGHYVNFHGTSYNSSTSIISGGLTKEFVEAYLELCRKYKKLFFDENEHVRDEVYAFFEGHKNKEFNAVVIDYIRNSVIFDE